MLILCSSKKRGITLDRIVAYDFMTLYGCDFGASTFNLHGVNHFKFSELAAKRITCSKGIKSFVLEGLISVTQTKNGFLYSVTPVGEKYVKALKSDYKQQYLDTLKVIQEKYDSVLDAELLKIINNTGITALRR